MVLILGVPAIELLAAPSSVVTKPATLCKAADVPTVACIWKFRNSYLCALVQLLGFFLCAGVNSEKHESESVYRGGQCFSHTCICLLLESGKIQGYKISSFRFLRLNIQKLPFRIL